MELLNNPWISGIGGGIISGFIVYFVTSFIFSRKENKEYLQKMRTANNELLYIMRPLIAQKKFPKKDMLESIIESTARKYVINKNDLLSVSLIADDLIKEVMENAFLSSEQKNEFCKTINGLKREPKPKYLNEVVFQKDRISSKYMSAILAMTATFMVAALQLLTSTNETVSIVERGISNKSEIVLTAVFTPIIATVLALYFRNIKQLKKINHRIKKLPQRLRNMFLNN